MPLRYVLPRRARVWYEGHRSTVGYVFLVVYITVVGGLALQHDATEGKRRDIAIRESGRKAFRQIERSRVDATRQSCRQRNTERKTQRGQLQRQIDQTKAAPPGSIEQFGISRQKALHDLRDDKRAVHRIDCKAAVRKVRRSSPDFPPLNP